MKILGDLIHGLAIDELDPNEALVDVVLSGISEERIREELQAVLGTDLVSDVFPELDALFAIMEAKSPKEIAFEREVRAAQKRVNEFEASVTKQLTREINTYRLDVLDKISQAGLSDYAAHRLETVKADLARSERGLTRRLNGIFTDAATQASALALAGVDDPIRLALGGVGLPPGRLPLDQLAIIKSYTPDLISGITKDTAKKVQTVLSHKVLGGINAREARQRIGKLVGELPSLKGRQEIPGKVFSGLRIRTDNIMRTELNRAYNLTSTARIDELATKIPGIGKAWIHRPGASRNPRSSHARLGGKVIFPGEGEKFELSGRDGTFLVDGPHDPALPASESNNCHCRTRIAYSEEVAAEQKRRGDFEKEPTGPAVSKKVKKKAPAKKAPAKKKAVKKPAPKKKPGEIPKPPKRDAPVQEHLDYQNKLLSRDLDKYPKGSDGKPMAYYERARVDYFGKADNHIEKLWKAAADGPHFDRELAEAVVRDMSDDLFWAAQECKRRGIPALRGVRYNEVEWAAAMGDGILGINPSSQLRRALRGRTYLKSNPKIIDLNQAMKAENEVAGILKGLDDKIAGMVADPATAYSKKGMRELRKARAAAAKLHEEAADYRNKISAWDYDDALPDFALSWESGADYNIHWKPDGRKIRHKAEGFTQWGDSRPVLTHSFGRTDLVNHNTFRHEFGHHIHQVTDWARTGERVNYALYSRIEQEGFKKLGHWKGLRNTSTYADYTTAEWFAENYASYSVGRLDRVSPKFLEFLKAWGLE